MPRVTRAATARRQEDALLVMKRVDGSSLSQLPSEQISDQLLRRLWTVVDRLHRAGIATGYI